MSIAQNILDMIDAGCTLAQIEAYARKQAGRDEEARLAKQEAWRQQKRSQRSSKNNDGVRADIADISGHCGQDDEAAPISREYNTTRAPALIPVGLSNDNPPIDKKTNKKVSAPDGAVSAFSAEFERFWAAYPKKVGKAAAIKNFDKAVKAGADPEKIILGAAAYARSVAGADPRYTKQAQGWLTDGRWNDEPSSRGPPRDPRFASMRNVMRHDQY